MGYDGKIMRRARQRLDEDKQLRSEQMQVRRQQVYREIPRIREIDGELSQAMSKIIAGALRQGTDPAPVIRVLRDENLELQHERAELLVQHGYSADYLEEKPNCSLCGDSGYMKGSVCSCLQRYYSTEQVKELSQMLDLGTQSFETFDFGWYNGAIDSDVGISSREQMEENYDACRDYAYQFGPRSGNLLLCGQSGLGKTFLSACVARVVSESGHSVVYDTAGHVFSQLENAKFRRDDEGEDDATRYENCDLLILDDLGTEMMTAFVQSAVYQLLNQRLIAGKKTVISTNLNPDELGRRYGSAVRSRLEGEYRILPFFGEDIRQLKRQRGQ